MFIWAVRRLKAILENFLGRGNTCNATEMQRE